MIPWRRWPLAVLALFVLASSWLLWQWRDDDAPPPLVGPPRSDYQLIDFELIALDEAGKESFAAHGPRLERHPQLATIDIEQPRFVFPNAEGERWTSRAERAWVNRDGSELRLIDKVLVEGPTVAAEEPIRLRSQRLTVFPKQDRVETDAAVTVTEPGSILRGRGMRADLATHRVELLSEVRIRHEAKP